MRDAPDISSATKTRIRALAEQMGYVPDSRAQGLRTRTTRLIGLVIPAITNPQFARVVMAIEEKAHELGYELLFAQTLNLPEREEGVIRQLISRRVDGLLISPVYRLLPVTGVYSEILRCRIPTVLLGPRGPTLSQFANVESDDMQAAARMTQHLLEMGHRRVAFLAGPQQALWAQERFEGYRRALREAELEVDDRLIFHAGTTIEEGGKAALQLLNERAEATALFAVNDLVAIGATNILLQQGIRVPAEMSVAGFGNILTSEHFRIPLTTVSQPKYRLGEAGLSLLAKLMRGGAPESVRLRSELVVRASTSMAPGQSSNPAPAPRPTT
jgi:LacI family transcriptional regulator